MKLKALAITEASDKQLLDYLRSFLNIETSVQASRDTLVSRINTAQPGKDDITIIVDSGDEPEFGDEPTRVLTDADAERGTRMDTGSSDDPRVVLVIHEQQGLGNFGKRAVPVAVNGRTMLIPRGKECNIPYRYFEALRLAMETQFEDVVDADTPTKVDRVETNGHSYPFSVVEMPSRSEIKKWVESMADDQAAGVQARKQKEARTIAAAIGAAHAAA